MIRLIFWIAVIFVAIWLWRKFKSPARETPPRSEPGHTHVMVRCAQCGVHLSQTSALPHDNQWYCSRPHLEQGPSSRAR
ncbi:PP0621 family protein [Pseudomonas sp. nanlin1]|uniref:PP0621 family protein n=1 Tax=Pseudomonas sp. nanlin1 TaxID=3040605 RepID=UPI00388FEFF8